MKQTTILKAGEYVWLFCSAGCFVISYYFASLSALGLSLICALYACLWNWMRTEIFESRK